MHDVHVRIIVDRKGRGTAESGEGGMSQLLKFEEVRLAISECSTMGELKEWNDRLEPFLSLAFSQQNAALLIDVVKISKQIKARMHQLLSIKSELLRETLNEI